MAQTKDKPQDLPAGEPDEGKQLDLLLSTAQDMTREEFQRSERLEAKSRNQFTAVGALFAVVMATTAGVLNLLQANQHKLQAWVLPVVGCCAVIATVSLGTALGLSVKMWWTRRTDALDPETIRGYIRYAERGNVGVAKRLIEAYVSILDDRRTQNADRVKNLKDAAKGCLVAACAALLQLCAVFAAIIFK